jgi:starvation-inducible DNA-binding protein
MADSFTGGLKSYLQSGDDVTVGPSEEDFVEIAIDDEGDASGLIEAMKIVLGTSFALYLKMHVAHWNVEGPDFPALHAFFGEMYAEIWASIDETAEQIRQLDAYAPSSMERMLELSKVVSLNDPLPARDLVLTLITDQEIMLGCLSDAFHTAEATDKQGLANYLAERMEAHSKHRWQLRATSKKLRGV